VVIVAAPPWFVHDRSLEGLRAQNEVRTTLLQGLDGVALLAAASLAYLQLTNGREQLRIGQLGQVTERFTRAIDQVGHAQVDVRLGGIYALERIARDSPADRATIREVLVAFIRNRAPWPPSRPGQYGPTAPIDGLKPLREWAPDLQACLSALGRDKSDRLDLHALDLRGACLAGAHLEGANLVGARLEKADLSGAHLEGALLRDANLEAADLRGAWLEDAVLVGARLAWADLSGAHLPRANLAIALLDRARLTNADMRKVNLIGARLEFADLGGAHLEGAVLRRTMLTTALLDGVLLLGAVTDEHTRWPDGFDWREAGATG
jgi:hypothetical protein